jgi:hypothetical protein
MRVSYFNDSFNFLHRLNQRKSFCELQRDGKVKNKNNMYNIRFTNSYFNLHLWRDWYFFQPCNKPDLSIFRSKLIQRNPVRELLDKIPCSHCSCVKGVNIVNSVNALPKKADNSAEVLKYYKSHGFTRKK